MATMPLLGAAVADKGDLKVLAVTVLTSFDISDMQQMGMTGSIEDLVLIRAKKALTLGCDGVVSSALEAKPLRDGLGGDFFIVTPGIRPESATPGQDDQKTRRYRTAGNAKWRGSYCCR